MVTADQLPADLGRILSEREFDTLMLPPGVSEVPGAENWRIRRLILRGSGLSTLNRLPKGLELLDLRDVVAISKIPESSDLQFLDLTHTAVTNLPGNYQQLRSLGLGIEQEQILQNLDQKAPNLTGLFLTVPAGHDGSTLLDRIPKALRALSLEGAAFPHLRGSLTQLEELWLIETLVEDFRELDESKIHRMVLQRNIKLGERGFPGFLQDLEYQGTSKTTIDAGRLPKIDRLFWLGETIANLDQLPATVSHLRLPECERFRFEGFPQDQQCQLEAKGNPLRMPSSIRRLEVEGTLETLCAGLPVHALTVTGKDLHVPEIDLSSLDCLQTAGDSQDRKAAFRELRRLEIRNSNLLTKIKGLDVAAPELVELVVSNAPLQTLPALPKNLKILDIRRTGITRLPSILNENSALEVLIVDPFQLASLENLPLSVRVLLFAEVQVEIETPFLRSSIGGRYGVQY